jgi:1,4-dihydroxy-2-naphthoyl-CoA synthase
MTAQHFVRYDVDDKVAVITLDRPEAANAQTAGILKDLDDAWRPRGPGHRAHDHRQTLLRRARHDGRRSVG